MLRLLRWASDGTEHTLKEAVPIDLLVKMGYGGSRVDAAEAIGNPVTKA